VDSILADDRELMKWARVELADLLEALPPEVAAGDVPKLDDTAELKRLLIEAEATVLARLTAAGESA
jgi:exonuclease SbcD